MAYSDALTELLTAAERAAKVSGSECDVSVMFGKGNTKFSVTLKECSDEPTEIDISQLPVVGMLDEKILGDCLQYFGDLAELLCTANEDGYSSEVRSYISKALGQLKEVNLHIRSLIELANDIKYGELGRL